MINTNATTHSKFKMNLEKTCYTWQGNFKHYFGLGCIKRFARDLLQIETENNFKHNENMIFTEGEKLYHETNNTCHICSKACINKI